jgi:TrmH family RNA methyltransferase
MRETVTSLHNQLVKTAASLRQKKYRDELGLFVVEGVRLVEDLTGAGWPAEFCLFTAAAAANPRAAKVLSALADGGCRLVEVTEAVYGKATDTEEPQGIMVVAGKRPVSLADILARPAPLIAVLDDIRDPGNAGTVVRTAAAAGCSGVVLLKGCADLYAGKTVRATMGALFTLPVVDGQDRQEFLDTLAKAGIPLVATALEGAKPYFEGDLSGPAAIVFGNEGRGVSAELLTAAASRLFIPLYGRVESLNVAAAAAVILYEAARQRRASL